MHDDLWEGRVPRETGRLSKLSVTVTLLALGAFAFWATTAELDSASVASGNFTVTGRNRVVQHLEGGVIEKILVTEGDRVVAGELLLRLNDAEARAELERLESRAFRLRSVEARLRAEIAGSDDFVRPSDLVVEAAQDPDRADALEVQSALFFARKDAQESAVRILAQGVAAYRENLAGQREQLNAAEAQLNFVIEDREARETLVAKGLTNRQNVLSVKRAEAQMEGERARLRASILDGMERIVRGEQLVTNARLEAMERAVFELDQTQAELRDLMELIGKANRAIARLDIRAPAPGVVVKLEVNSAGGVIRPGAKILELVPVEGELVIEARVRPQDIDSVRLGQAAQVRLTAFSQRTTPMIAGKVIYISADTLEGDDVSDRRDSYVARVTLDRDHIPEEVRAALTPGMPAELYIRTGTRTFAAYLLQPLTDSMRRAFKEN
ncbi:HlyD family type I secretion periplasmic adaptor subunit [Celeribacter marinus]|uniref:HlyD family type I secretion periplasmic adaptor subunit n=1 Tax=Celeribacter marinus TaxID=1397108 RepID=UPI0031707369